jgi:hypothetical protein
MSPVAMAAAVLPSSSCELARLDSLRHLQATLFNPTETMCSTSGAFTRNVSQVAGPKPASANPQRRNSARNKHSGLIETCGGDLCGMLDAFCMGERGVVKNNGSVLRTDSLVLSQLRAEALNHAVHPFQLRLQTFPVGVVESGKAFFAVQNGFSGLLNRPERAGAIMR